MNIKLQVKPKKLKGNHVPMEIYESGLGKIIANGLKFDVESTSLFVLNLNFIFNQKIQSFYQISNKNSLQYENVESIYHQEKLKKIEFSLDRVQPVSMRSLN